LTEYHITLNLTVSAKDYDELEQIAEDAKSALATGKQFPWKLIDIEADDLEEAY
jgi:hypothetical protein